MNRDSFIFYKSFFEAIRDHDSKNRLLLYDAICNKDLYDKETELRGIAGTLYKLIKPQIEANTKKYSDGKKGGRPKIKTTGYQKEKTTGFENKKPNENVNVNENDNENVNVNVEGVESDSCVDDFQQSDSCVDEIVRFYEENIGMITPHEFEVLDSYRKDFSDDLIIYALKQQVEAKATGIKYAKAILNSWKNKNIKTLLEAQNENKQVTKSNEKVNNAYHLDNQYIDFSKYYAN